MNAADRTQVTYRFERWRALASGIIETAGATFPLLIAVRWFEAGALSKAIVAAGGSVGFVLAPWIVTRVAALRWPVSKATSRLAVLGAITFLVMAVAPFQLVFVAGSVLAKTTSTVSIPLMTQIYQENYPERGRGRLFSRASMIRIATAALFSEIAARMLSLHLPNIRWL